MKVYRSKIPAPGLLFMQVSLCVPSQYNFLGIVALLYHRYDISQVVVHRKFTTIVHAAQPPSMVSQE